MLCVFVSLARRTHKLEILGSEAQSLGDLSLQVPERRIAIDAHSDLRDVWRRFVLDHDTLEKLALK
jgi:hypothetical protein